MEAMSVAENLDALGAPLPASLKNVINNVGRAAQEDDFMELTKKVEERQHTINALTKKE